MYQIDFHKPLHIHFIGIGGISMSGLAEILLEENFRISGSDAKSSPLTRTLEERGAVIYYGQRASNIKDDVDVVVYTAAIHPDNPEFACAKEKRASNAHPRRASGTDHAELRYTDRNFRNPRKNHYYFHGFPYPS